MATGRLCFLAVFLLASASVIASPPSPAASALAAGPRAGEFDPRYPAMGEWARAGVRGVPPRDLPVLARVTPGNDLQAALDTTAAQGGGVVELAAGEFVLTKTLRLRSDVVLRGAADGATTLHLKLRGPFVDARDADGFAPWTTGLHGRAITHAGLERLTIVFDSSLPAPPDTGTHKRPFVNNPENRDDLWVVSVRFTQSEDCWVDDCRILNSGTHPVLIEGSRHITVRNTEIAGAHNKGEPNAGWVEIAGSEHVLLDGITVRDLRHLVLHGDGGGSMYPCRHNVLVRCRLAVDVVMRDGAGQNLVEDCTVEIPPGHPWPPFGIGIAQQNQPPGPGNLVFRCRATHAFGNSKRSYAVAEDPAQVYALLTDFKLAKKNRRHVVRHGPAPAGDTLYRAR